MQRREFFQLSLSAGAIFFGLSSFGPSRTYAGTSIISPGCRTSKVKVAKIYLGVPKAHWPTPAMDLAAEMARYEQEFANRQQEIADVEFSVNRLISTTEELDPVMAKLQEADGILLIHLSMGISPVVNQVLATGKPTVIFAAPYSGHEWAGFGNLLQQEAGKHLECLLTADYDQLTAALRPFRAIHHLREAKVLNVTSREMDAGYLQAVQEKFGTVFKPISRERMLEFYQAVSDDDARAEQRDWIQGAVAVVEPPEDEIFRSCKLALAFERLLEEEEATAITVDCYGTMYRQLPAFPCIGFTRLNDKGLGGICESDLQCAMTHILFQGLSGKPGFISDPTMDVSRNSAILAHCLGTRCMDGPNGARAPYKLRTIMERQEGAVPQVFMRTGEKVTQSLLVGNNRLLYFTGTIIEAPDTERGCRTKITVQVDGDAERLWKNWSQGLHRVTCYSDISQDLERFCRFKDLELMNEA